MSLYRVGADAMVIRTMARKRRLYKVAEGTYLLADSRPVLVSGVEAARILGGMVAARRVGLGYSMTAEQRSERGRRAVAARWAKAKREKP